MNEAQIRVAVRSRPLLPGEEEAIGILSFEGNSVKIQNKIHYFDYVFYPYMTNESVYKVAVAEKLPCIFQGYNVTILAYGPTGSGKTYTMGTQYIKSEYNQTNLGIIPRAINEIFEIVESLKEKTEFTIKISFLELYREDIFDLLQKSAICTLREDTAGVKVMNLEEKIVCSVEEALETFANGSKARRSSQTAKNMQSSRSHAIFCVYVEQTDKITFDFKRAKFQLVDLAGSERLNTSKTVGVQRKEGININLGLLSLGKVITHLTEDKPHVPYRESKLTRLLQDSLGGNSHTVMIACINPSTSSIEETMSTIRYASNARKIKNRPEVNCDPLPVQVEKLKKQVLELQAALNHGSSNAGSVSTSYTVDSSAKSEHSLHPQLQDSYQKIDSLSKKLTELNKKNKKLVEEVASVNEKTRLLTTELTTEANTNPLIEVYVQKLEETYADYLQILAKYKEDVVMGDVFEEPECSEPHLDEASICLESSNQDFTQKQIVEEFTEYQRQSSEKLEYLSKSLDLRASAMRSLQEYNRSLETIDQDKINIMINKMEALAKEREELEAKMKKMEKKFEKESRLQIEKYESEIKQLQCEIHQQTYWLKCKERNEAKIKKMQVEIQDLKQKRVETMKKIKEDARKFTLMQKEKDLQVKMLLKEGGKKKAEFSKMKISYEKQLTVLKQKIEAANARNQKSILDYKEKISAGQKKRFKPSHRGMESIEDNVDDVLKVLSFNCVTKVQIELAEKEMTDLKEKLDEDVNLEENEVILLQSKLHEIEENVQQMKTNIDYESEKKKLNEFNESLKTLSGVKMALDCLIKKFLCIVSELEKLKHTSNVELTKLTYYEEKIKDAETARNELIERYEEQLKNLELKHNAKVLRFLTEIQELHNSMVGPETSSQYQERIETQAQEIEKLQVVYENYNKKCKEVEDLHHQLLHAKTGKKVKWLADLTNNPSKSTESSRSVEEHDRSMMEEFLSSENEESFSADKDDPDFRLTPMYKRKGKASKKVSPSEQKISPQKISCSCQGQCSTLRCRCKKYKIFCSLDCCCVKSNCINFEHTKLPSKRKLSLEE